MVPTTYPGDQFYGHLVNISALVDELVLAKWRRPKTVKHLANHGLRRTLEFDDWGRPVQITFSFLGPKRSFGTTPDRPEPLKSQGQIKPTAIVNIKKSALRPAESRPAVFFRQQSGHNPARKADFRPGGIIA